MRHKYERTAAARKQRKTSYTKFLDKLTFVVGAVGPFTVLPQILTIYGTKSATGVSATTWALIFVVTFPWILYGLAHKEKNIIVSFILWEVMNATVFIGALIYR